MRKLPFVTGLVLWALFVWGNRLSNIWRADDAFGDQVVSSLLAAAMIAGALAVAAFAFRRHELTGTVVTIYAVATVAVWGARIIGILLGDWGLAFTVVHALLGVVSSVLVLAAVREVVGREADGDDAAAMAGVDSGPAGSAG